MNPKEFVYIWKYTVKEDKIYEFTKTYGEEGEWVKLFRKSSDYILTQLLNVINDPFRFITIDRWKNKEARDNFIKLHRSEYQELNERCNNLTIKEELLGEFYSVRESEYFSKKFIS